MVRTRRFVVLSIALISCGLPLAAQTPSPSPSAKPTPSGAPATKAGEVVVSATRWETPVFDSPNATNIIKMDDRTAVAPGFVDNLSGVPGLGARSYGSLGTTTFLAARGASSEQTLVLVDGSPVNLSRDGLIDFSTILMPDLEVIEVVRGGGSFAYGSNAVGGTINLVPRRTDGTVFRYSFRNGSYLPTAGQPFRGVGTSPAAQEANYLALLDTQEATVYLAIGLDQGGFAVFGGLTKALNSYAFNYLGSPYNRTDSDFLNLGAGASFNRTIGPGELFARVSIANQNLGSPGSLSFYSKDRQTRSSVDGLANYTAENFGVHLFAKTDYLAYLDSFGVTTSHRGSSVNGDGSFRLNLSDMIGIEGGAGAAYDVSDSTNSGYHQRGRLSAWVDAPLTLGPVVLTPGGRLDWYSDFGAALTGKLTGILKLGDEWRLRLNASTAFRAPSFNSLYYADSYGNIPNPNLKPEVAYQGDVGLRFKNALLSIDTSIFARYLEQEMLFITNTTQNIGKTFTPGAELAVGLKPTKLIEFNAAYTFQIPYVLQDNAGLTYTLPDKKLKPYVPQHKLRLGMDLNLDKLKVDLETVTTGERFTDTANTYGKSLWTGTVVNATLSYAIAEQCVISIGGRNLSNASYQEIADYPAPPLSIWLGVEGKIK